jgi:hypothetical protein
MNRRIYIKKIPLYEYTTYLYCRYSIYGERMGILNNKNPPCPLMITRHHVAGYPPDVPSTTREHTNTNSTRSLSNLTFIKFTPRSCFPNRSSLQVVPVPGLTKIVSSVDVRYSWSILQSSTSLTLHLKPRF